jgi:hypothetical protein
VAAYIAAPIGWFHFAAVCRKVDGMSVERWYVEQCAQHWGIKPSTWRDYVSDGRAPAAAGHDPATGRKWWRPAEVRASQADREGQGARTDLADGYLTAPDGRRVFVSPHTIAAADLLSELTTAADRPATVTRAQLRDRWDAEFPEDSITRRVSPGELDRRIRKDAAARRTVAARGDGRRVDGTANSGGTLARQRVKEALRVLDVLGVIRRDGELITVLDRAALRRVAAM